MAWKGHIRGSGVGQLRPITRILCQFPFHKTEMYLPVLKDKKYALFPFLLSMTQGWSAVIGNTTFLKITYCRQVSYFRVRRARFRCASPLLNIFRRAFREPQLKLHIGYLFTTGIVFAFSPIFNHSRSTTFYHTSFEQHYEQLRVRYDEERTNKHSSR